MRRTVAAILLVLGLAGVPAAAMAGAVTAWVQMTGAGAEARAVADGPACPALLVDSRTHPMTLRAGPDEGFANRICEAPLPKGAKRASVEGVVLPLPKVRPQRLVILGDSGCRLKGPVVQDCNDPVAGWPFAKVAALAAAQKPDLVIHVGDYYYRETPCPPLMAGCAGSPWGDKWPTWKAELFDPAAGLLKAAPWVFARGNHEDCQRGGKGWFRLLDADPKAQACPAGHSATFAVDIGGARLAVLDSADPDDTHLNADQTAAFAADLKSIPAGATPVWLVTHRPLWEVFRTGAGLVDTGGNANERQAAKSAGLGGAELIVAGHLHTFYSLDAVTGRPSQLVVGTGGDTLDSNKAATPLQATIPVDGAETPAFAMDRFGYFVLDRVGHDGADDWVGVFHDLTDKVIARCTLRARRLACVAA